MFNEGQAHFCVWWALGHLVNIPIFLNLRSKDYSYRWTKPLSLTTLPLPHLLLICQSGPRKPRRRRRQTRPIHLPRRVRGSRRHQPPSSSHSGDGQYEARAEAWEKLFSVINEALHIASMLVECLNPDLAQQYYELSKTLKKDNNKHGRFLKANECFLPGVTVHFNMQPIDGDFHFDRMSMYHGWVGFPTPSKILKVCWLFTIRILFCVTVNLKACLRWRN